jgi:hypothetical protein
MKSLSKKTGKIEADDIEDEMSLYADQLTDFDAGDHGDTLDELADQLRYIAGEDTSADFSEYLKSKKEELDDMLKEHNRWEALSGEEQEAELAIQKEEERKADEEHTAEVNRRVDAALASGWRPDGFQSHQPPELREMASPKSADKIKKRLSEKGFPWPKI